MAKYANVFTARSPSGSTLSAICIIFELTHVYVKLNILNGTKLMFIIVHNLVDVSKIIVDQNGEITKYHFAVCTKVNTIICCLF
jgi:hypothetical protein